MIEMDNDQVVLKNHEIGRMSLEELKKIATDGTLNKMRDSQVAIVQRAMMIKKEEQRESVALKWTYWYWIWIVGYLLVAIVFSIVILRWTLSK
jgi:hypothetical protein